MPDSRQLEIVPAQNGSTWPNSLGTQYFTSLRRHCAGVAAVRSLEDLSTSLTNAAAQSAEKPLDCEFIETAARSLAVQFALSTVQQIVSHCAAICESPLETAVAFALGVLGLQAFGSVHFDFPAGVVGNADSDTVLRIQPQARIDEYRVDFLLTVVAYEDTGGSISVAQKQLVLEVDGFEFHDAEISQLVRDRRRDRQLQLAGYSVFRVSGGEVWRDVFGCARETVAFLKAAVDRERQVLQRKPTARENNYGSVTRAASL